MIFVFLVLLGFVSFFLVYSSKYNNPYKLVFIFGKKGSGKSTYMVRCMLKDLKKGWNVYTDIQDCVVPGVRIINGADLNKFVPETNSSIYLDEVGISFDNRNFKNFDTGLRDFFKLQRKYKCKVVMNSQSFDVDKKIRDVTDSMILQSSFLNMFTLSRPIIRKVALVEASSAGDSRIADNLKFDSIFTWRIYYMPAYFKYFESFKAPERPPITYRQIAGEVKRLSIKSVFKAMQAEQEVEEDDDI